MRSAGGTTLDFIAIALGLYQGWYVSTSDYEGPKGAFTDGLQAGQALLDSLRAVKQSTEFTGIQPTTLIALNGGSGGALASEWALELHQHYAPDVNIVGATLGSLTPNVTEVYNTINGGLFAGLGPAGIVGLANQWPQMSTFLNETLKPETAADFMKAGSQCLPADQTQFAGQNITDYFKDPNFMQLDVPQATINSLGIMGLHGLPDVPMYIYKGYSDEISNVADTDALVEKYCSQGANITYIRNTATGHEGESVLGILGAFFFMESRFNYVPTVPGCTYVNITKTSLDDAETKLLGPGLTKALNSILPLGELGNLIDNLP